MEYQAQVFRLFILIMSFATLGSANAQVKLATFTVTEATLKNYKPLYIINSKDEKKIADTLRNMRNAMSDSRLKES